MKGVSFGLIWTLTFLWVILMLPSGNAPIATAILASGSFLNTTLVLIALSLVIGIHWRDICLGICLGAAACTITGPLIAFGLTPNFAYLGAAAVLGCLAAIWLRPEAFAYLIAGMVQTLCLIALARRQFGLAGSQLEADPSMLLPMGALWAVIFGLVLVGRFRAGSENEDAATVK